jgi:hypothetical protein
LIERTFGRLANGGVFNVVIDQPLPRNVSVDIGRMHYDHLLVVGTDRRDLSAAYTPVRTQLKPGGVTWILGAAGPMGQMHLLRALSLPGRPGKIVATNLHARRMEPVRRQLARQAAASGVDLVYFSNDEFADDDAFFARKRVETGGRGYDDIAIMAPTVAAIEQASEMTAADAVVNVFAGLTRGTQARIDLNQVAAHGVRYTGASGSSIDDLRAMRDLVESKQLPTNRSVAAIAGLEGVAEGLEAVANGRFAGKVVIYPNLRQPLPADASRGPGDGAALGLRQAGRGRYVDERGRSRTAARRCYVIRLTPRRAGCCIFAPLRLGVRIRDEEGMAILQDRIALVTGGAQGLGAAICERLAREGAHVVVADIKLEQAAATATAVAE